MKASGWLLRVCSLAILALCPVLLPGTARAGEVSVYVKSGWFAWDERLNGSLFVKERGALHGAGISRRDLFSDLSVAESAEVWGGNVDYDGHDLTGTTPIKSDTSYLGTKEEVALGVKLPAGSVSVEPFLGAGHRFWIRTRSGEDWNTIYAKAGVTGEVRRGTRSLYLKGGALLPLYTRSHVSLSNAGYSDVVTRPKAQFSAFAEGGVRLGSFAVSAEYEGMRFGRSDMVPTSRRTGPSGTVVMNSQAFQPDSESDLVSLKLAWSF